MNVRTQAAVLLAFGLSAARLAQGDALLHYVNPSSRLWVFVAGVAVALLAAVLLALAVFDRSAGAARTHGATWAILAPLAVIVLIAPPALGSFTAVRSRPAAIDPRRADFPALSNSQPARLTTLDFVSRALSHGGRTLAGHRVEVTGFVLRSTRDGFVLSRLVITCCAADAAAVSIAVVTGELPPPRDSWVTAIGSFAGLDGARSRDGPPVVRLRAVSVTPIAVPADAYEH